MRLEHFIAQLGAERSQVALPSRDLETYYRDACVPGIEAQLGPGVALTGFDVLKGAVLNFVGQIALKRMLCVGPMTWPDYLFLAYESYSNFIVTAGLPAAELRPPDGQPVNGPFGWNVAAFPDIGPDALTTVVKPGYSYLTIIATGDMAMSRLWLEAGAPMLVGGGRLVLCGEASVVDALGAALDPQKIQGVIASPVIRASCNREFKAMTCTSRNLAAAVRRASPLQ